MDPADPNSNEPPNVESLERMANALATPKPTESHQIPAGVQVGAGLPPVPGKLAKRITCWEYVDMADVVAVLWPLPNVPEGTSSKPRRQIQDINLWLQCYYSDGIQIPRIHTPAVSIYGHNIKSKPGV